MASTRYVRRDFIIRIRVAGEDQAALVEVVDGERAVRRLVPRATVQRLTGQTPAAEISSALWSAPEIRAAFALWQQAGATATRVAIPHGGEEQFVERICLWVDDDRLAALPLEQSLAGVLAKPGYPRLLILRLVPVPPRVAQVPLTLPLRLLQLDRRRDFDLPGAVRKVFGKPARGRLPASLVQVKADRARQYAGWNLPLGWKTVDVLHIDRLTTLPEPRRLARSAPSEIGTLGWLVRCADLWRTRLVVMRGRDESEMALLRRFAHRLTFQGGPAVWLVDDGVPDGAQLIYQFYDRLIHDTPVDVSLATAVQGLPLFGTLFVGAGREELSRVSAPGENFASLAKGLRDPDTRANIAGELWSAVAPNVPDIEIAAQTFAKTVRGLEGIADAQPSWSFDAHENGIVPLSEAIGRLRQIRGTEATAATEVRPTPDQSGPRFANIDLWQLDAAAGRKEPIPQRAARLRQGKPILIGVQLGPRTGSAAVLDAIALIEEPFKWESGREGVWLFVGVTGLDFTVTGIAIQEVWLPRRGASDVVEFVVEPMRAGISQLRLCIYHGADLLQSHRLAAIVETATGARSDGTSTSLAAALGVAAERIGDAGWMARMEYAATADLAAPPAGRDVALSIFANHFGDRRVFTIRGTEGYEVLLAGDTSDLTSDIRKTLDAVSRDNFNLYAFREREEVPLHSASPQQRDAALQDLAQAGWALYAEIFNKADRLAMAGDLAGDQRVIHVAHSLLENVIPWAGIYDRPYSSGRRKDEAGRPLLRTVCAAGLPDATGKFTATECGTHPTCPLSAKGRADAIAASKGIAEEAIVCARHFWGFRHIIELPPYQEDAEAAPSTIGAGTHAAPPRRAVTSAGNPVRLLLGYNAALGTAKAHRAELHALLAKCKLKAVWNNEVNSGDAFLAALGAAEPDLVYLFCHARGGLADPATRPPALELQEAVGREPSLIRAADLATGLQLTHHPIVILNGCNTAVFSPDALSPFIRHLVRDCEAAGVLGTEIPVFELLASEVARQFLTRFLDGESAGKALLDIRLDLLARGNPMGLAYTLYAVAELKIVQ